MSEQTYGGSLLVAQKKTIETLHSELERYETAYMKSVDEIKQLRSELDAERGKVETFRAALTEMRDLAKYGWSADKMMEIIVKCEQELRRTE